MNSEYKILFSSGAEKTLVKMEKDASKRILNALEKLRNDPFEHPHTKKMKGVEENIYRLRVGDYRVIYEIKNDELMIYVIRVGPRGDIYK